MESKRSPWPLCIIVIPCGNVFLVNMGLDLCFLFLWKQWLSWGGELYPCSPKKYITVKLTGAFSCTHSNTEKDVHSPGWWGGVTFLVFAELECFWGASQWRCQNLRRKKKAWKYWRNPSYSRFIARCQMSVWAGRDEIPMDTEQERSLEGDFRKRGETLRQGRTSGIVTTQVSSLHGFSRGTFEKV